MDLVSGKVQTCAEALAAVGTFKAASLLLNHIHQVTYKQGHNTDCGLHFNLEHIAHLGLLGAQYML